MLTKIGWLVGLFYRVSILFGSFNAELNFKQFSISIVFVYKQLNVKTVLFQTIQFSISTQFSSIWPIGPYQVLQLRDRVDLGAMVMKGYSAFSKAPVLVEPHHQIV